MRRRTSASDPATRTRSSSARARPPGCPIPAPADRPSSRVHRRPGSGGGADRSTKARTSSSARQDRRTSAARSSAITSRRAARDPSARPRSRRGSTSSHHRQLHGSQQRAQATRRGRRRRRWRERVGAAGQRPSQPRQLRARPRRRPTSSWNGSSRDRRVLSQRSPNRRSSRRPRGHARALRRARRWLDKLRKRIVELEAEQRSAQTTRTRQGALRPSAASTWCSSKQPIEIRSSLSRTCRCSSSAQLIKLELPRPGRAGEQGRGAPLPVRSSSPWRSASAAGTKAMSCVVVADDAEGDAAGHAGEHRVPREPEAAALKREMPVPALEKAQINRRAPGDCGRRRG